MSDYLSALLDPALPFARNALAAALLSSVLFGTLGSLVTVRRVASLAGSISHAVLGGIGLSLFLASRGILAGVPPVAGALLAALLAAFLVARAARRGGSREDTAISAIWAIGMSLGVLFLSRVPGYADPMSYLFGNILLVSVTDLAMLAVLDAIALAACWFWMPQLEATAFDEDFARSRGARTDRFFLGLLAFVAAAVVLLQTFIGIVMVIAMLSLPAGTASLKAKSLPALMALSTLLAAVFSLGGLAVSWSFDLPAGATVVTIAGAVFVLATGAKSLSARLRRARTSRPAGPDDAGSKARPGARR